MFDKRTVILSLFCEESWLYNKTVVVTEPSRSFVPQDDRKRGDISKIVILVPVTASPVMRMARAID